MFWTIVGALLFVFVGIPILINLFGAGVYALTLKGTWRFISGLVGIILVIVMWANHENGDWGIIGLGALGLYMLFLGIIGSFSPSKWKEFWADEGDKS
jgi:hypothetical protein